MKAIKEAVQKLKIMGGLPASLLSVLEAALREDAARKFCDCNQGRLPCTCKPAEQSQGEPAPKMTLKQLLADLPDGYSKDDVAYGWHECVDNHTHADPAEVERLRAVVNRCRNRVSKVITDKLKLRLERDNLRAQLATETARADAAVGDTNEAERKLAEVRAIIERVKVKGLVSPVCPLGQRIDAALSASAEPSERKPITPKFGVLAGEPEILGERCADGGKCHHLCKTECFRKYGCVPLSGSGLTDDWKEPSAPAEIGERTAFEKHYHDRIMGNRTGVRFLRSRSGGYLDNEVREMWSGWQARAALERKP